MEKLRNRMSYLNGMADGLGISSNSKEGRMVVEIMRVMEEMVSKMDPMDHRIDEQEEYLEAVDEDLADLEEFVEAIDEDLDDVESVLYWDDEDEDELEDNGIYFDDEDDEVIMVDGVYDEMEGYDDDDMGFFELECPNCQELVSVDQDIFEDDMVAEVLCPDCHEVILINDDINEENEFDQYVID